MRERERERERREQTANTHNKQKKMTTNKQGADKETNKQGKRERGGLLVQEASDSYSTREMSNIMSDIGVNQIRDESSDESDEVQIQIHKAGGGRQQGRCEGFASLTVVFITKPIRHTTHMPDASHSPFTPPSLLSLYVSLLTITARSSLLA